MKATEQYFPVVLFIMLYKIILTFESVDEILKCDHSNESYWALLSCGAVYYAVQSGSNLWACGWNPKVWLISIFIIRQLILASHTVIYPEPSRRLNVLFLSLLVNDSWPSLAIYLGKECGYRNEEQTVTPPRSCKDIYETNR